MEYIRVTKENLEKEHICCAISNNKDIQVSSKKAWLADRFDEGLVFLKSVERGKCFIEYIPAECAWNPIEEEEPEMLEQSYDMDCRMTLRIRKSAMPKLRARLEKVETLRFEEA